MTSRTIRGIDVRVEGEGPPLVLLAGFGQTSAVWTSVVPRLSSRYTCVLLDNRGVGTGADRSPVTLEGMADDVRRVIEGLGGPVALMGWSMGGGIAQTLALRHPDALSALVLLSSSARRSEVQAAWAQARIALAGSDLGRESAETAVLPWLFSHRLLADHRRLQAIARANAAVAAAPIDQLRAQAEAMTGFDVTDRLTQLDVPTLVITGSEDLVTPVSDSVALAMAVPRAELVVLPHRGHAAVLESPSDVVAPVLAFLDRHALTGRGTQASVSPVAS
jgi:3-oxoadipate enol-lactonase